MADSFIARYPDASVIHWYGESNSFSWQSGYVMFAMEHLWKQSGNSAYLDYLRKFVDSNVGPEGEVPAFNPGALDNFLPGYACLAMHSLTGEERYAKAAETIRNGLRDYPRTELGMFIHNRGMRQVWVDGVFMGQMFLARYAAQLGHPEDFEEVIRQIDGVFSLCGRPDGLLYHGWAEEGKAYWQTSGSGKDYTGHSTEVWSEGMGWVAVLLADIFDWLPESTSGYERIKEYAVSMCNGLLTCQNPDTGLWCQVVDKPGAEGNWDETSGSGMFIYLLKRCLDKGWLPKQTEDNILKAYKSLRTKAARNADGCYNLTDCSSIGIQRDFEAYIRQPREISTFAAFGSFILGTSAVEF